MYIGIFTRLRKLVLIAIRVCSDCLITYPLEICYTTIISCELACSSPARKAHRAPPPPDINFPAQKTVLPKTYEDTAGNQYCCVSIFKSAVSENNMHHVT